MAKSIIERWAADKGFGTPAPVEESVDFNPRLHPRDRRGRFLDTPDIYGPVPTVGKAVRENLNPPKVKIDRQIAALKSREEVADYLTTTFKVKAEFGDTPPDDNPHFWQEIAQAVKDAERKYPTLQGGPTGHRFAGIVTVADLKGKADPVNAANDIWATTGDDPWHNPTMNPNDNRDVWTLLNDQNQSWDSDADPAAVAGLTAHSDQTPYGRLTHELGHAVALTSTLDSDKNADKVIEFYEAADLKPSDLREISAYGSQSPVEAWAELFSMMNTPGYAARLPANLKRKIAKVRTIANQWAKDNGVKGPVL